MTIYHSFNFLQAFNILVIILQERLIVGIPEFLHVLFRFPPVGMLTIISFLLLIFNDFLMFIFIPYLAEIVSVIAYRPFWHETQNSK